MDTRKMTQATTANLQKLLKERYGNHPPALNLINETIATLLDHRSVRSYTNQPLPAQTLETLVAAAQSAATSSNLQVWSVVAVQDQGRKDRLAALAGNQAHISACPLFLVWIADLSRLQTLGDKNQKAYDGLNYFEMMMVATIDSALAAQNAAVAAESLGLGTVYIGGIRNKPEEVAQELGLPARSFATFGMCVGYPDPALPTGIKPRLPQASVLHHEQYDASVHAKIIADYNASMETFSVEQGMKTSQPWELQSLHRVRGPEALSGRDKLVAALNKLGFDMK